MTRHDTLPLLVGGHAHGKENIDALAELGLGNFVWIPKKGYSLGRIPWDATHDIMADVDTCLRHGWRFLISQRRCTGDEWLPGGAEYGGDTWPDLHPPEAVRAIRNRAGERFTGLHAEEMDIGFVQNAQRESYRSRQPELFRFTDRAGGRKAFEAELNRLADRAHRSGAAFVPDLAAALQHCGFRTRCDWVICEMLESLPAAEMQLAWLRGGAQAFGKCWGVWISPWYRGYVPNADPNLWKAPQAGAGPQGGHTPSAFRRCLWSAWASGARVLTMQETEPLYGRRNGRLFLGAWGQELHAFWQTVRQHPEPVTPIGCTALLIDADCGYTPPNLHGGWVERSTLWGKLRLAEGDEALEELLRLYFPGYERDDPKDWWQHDRLYYPGYFCRSPLGPVDVVPADAPSDSLSHYPLIILAGEINMTNVLLHKLMQYVRQGGTLVACVNQLRSHERFVAAEPLFGTRIGEARMRSSWSGTNILMRGLHSYSAMRLRQPLGTAEPGEWHEPWSLAQDVQPTSAEVMADAGDSKPLLLRNRLGRGTAWLLTSGWGVEAHGRRRKLLRLTRTLIEALTPAPEVGLQHAAPDGIAWIAARQGSTALLAVSSHLSTPQEIPVRGPGGRRHLWGGDGVLNGDMLTIPAEGIAVVRFA